MGCTVFATAMGLFSKNSNGQGVGPLDTCLTPPTPPGVPVPVPYINVTLAIDLESGSVTVKADKGPTSIGTGKSKTKKSSGDEPGSAVTKGVASFTNTGKGEFKTASFTVIIEGEGADCMGDMMAQNLQGALLNCIDPAALVLFAIALAAGDKLKPCPKNKPYNKSCRPEPDPTAEQMEAVDGKPCWECQRDSGSTTPIKPLWNTTRDENGKIVEKTDRDKQVRQRDGKTQERRDTEAMTHDHQPPIKVAWEMGGCHMDKDEFKKLFGKKETVRPHCRAHYKSQGSQAKAFGDNLGHG